VPRITKDCFGTVIATLNKMKECVRCELLSECRSINWAAGSDHADPVVVRRPLPDQQSDQSAPPDDHRGATH
jgi:hypothetical protein